LSRPFPGLGFSSEWSDGSICIRSTARQGYIRICRHYELKSLRWKYETASWSDLVIPDETL
jgi:hypothetical protein